MERYWLAVLVVTFLAFSSANGAAFLGPGAHYRSDLQPADVAAAQTSVPILPGGGVIGLPLGNDMCTCCCGGGPFCTIVCFHCPTSCRVWGQKMKAIKLANQ